VPVTFRNGKGERVKERLRVLDFDNPLNNNFLSVPLKMTHEIRLKSNFWMPKTSFKKIWYNPNRISDPQKVP